jgi:hypothetical protein
MSGGLEVYSAGSAVPPKIAGCYRHGHILAAPAGSTTSSSRRRSLSFKRIVAVLSGAYFSRDEAWTERKGEKVEEEKASGT